MLAWLYLPADGVGHVGEHGRVEEEHGEDGQVQPHKLLLASVEQAVLPEQFQFKNSQTGGAERVHDSICTIP